MEEHAFTYPTRQQWFTDFAGLNQDDIWRRALRLNKDDPTAWRQVKVKDQEAQFFKGYCYDYLRDCDLADFKAFYVVLL